MKNKKSISIVSIVVIAVVILFVYLFASGAMKRIISQPDFSAGQLPAQATILATPVVTATNLTCSSVKLVWAQVPNAKGYEVYGPSSVCNVNGSAGYCGKTGQNGLSKNINGLAPSTTYAALQSQTQGFTVLAFRNSNYSSPSPRLSVTTPACGVTLPTVTITSPTTAATYTTTSAAISIGGNSTNAATVKWSINSGAQQFTTGVGSWSVDNIPLVAGTNTIVVTAYDAGGTASTPDTLVVTYNAPSTDTVAPTTTTAAPAAGWATTNISRTLTCTDTGGSGCASTFWKFVQSSTTCPSGPVGYTTGTVASTTVEGNYRLCYYSVDGAGNTESPIKFQEPYKLDSSAPTGSISVPTPGATVSGTTTLTAMVAVDSGSGTASAVFKIDGVAVGTDTSAPYSISWNSTTVANGSHTVTATLTDNAGNTTTTTGVVFSVSNSVAVATPTGLNTTGLTCNAFTLNWNAVAGATGYEVYGPTGCNGNSGDYCGLATTPSKAITGLTANTAYNVLGPNNVRSAFTVLAYNAAGQYSAPATRLAVTTPTCPSNAAPTAVITSPTSAATYATSSNTITLAGTAADDTSVASVTWRNQTTGATGTTTGTTSWTSSAITLQSGSNTLIVTATDGTGLTGTDTLTVTYTPTANQAPVVTITSPTSSSSYSTSSNFINLGGTATDDVSVSSVSYINQTTGFSAVAVGTGTWTTANIPLSVGANTIVVTATDNLGLTSTDTLTVTYTIATQASNWPAAASGAELGNGLTTGYEVSGAFWNPADQMLYFVSDGGKITRMDQNGGNVTEWSVGGNLEAITGTSAANTATMGLLYVVDESTTMMREFNPATGAYTNKSWSLAGSVPVAANEGVEGLTYVPNANLPLGYGTSTSGGMFYASSQLNGNIYVLDINLASSGSTPILKATITPIMLTPGVATDISDLYYATATNKLFVLFDGLNVVQEMRPSGLFVDEYKLPVITGATGEEAITTVPTCSSTNTAIVLGYDMGNASPHHVYKYSNYPQPCTDVNGPTITNSNVSVSGTTATFTWDTNEYADTKVEYGVGSYASVYNNTLLKTTQHIAVISGLTAGATYQYRLNSKDQAGNLTQTVNTFTTGGGGGSDPVIVSTGDIADNSGYQAEVASLIASINAATPLAAVLQNGDIAYNDGSSTDFANKYNPSWGVAWLKNLSRPVPGNHEYRTVNATGYFDYFNGVGVQTGVAGNRTQGWHSYNLGSWHIAGLNTNGSNGVVCSNISCAAGSAQELWLKNDLQTNTSLCDIAYWHHPRFASIGANAHSGYTDVQAMWQDLVDNGVDILLTGHNHFYERFAKMNGSGTTSSTGTRQFIIGTGGTPNIYAAGGFTTIAPNSEKRINNTNSYNGTSGTSVGGGYGHGGVLKLVLHPTSYDWQFINVNGTILDSGSDTCH